MIKKLPVIIVACFMASALNAQQPRVVSGTVTDASTHEPLGFATVALKKQMVGIVTNEAGQFDLYIPAGVENDTLLISYLGYRHQLIALNSISGPLNIKLQFSAIELNEIVVKPIAASEYVRMAMRSVRLNYPKDPFVTDAYYREKIIENKNLIRCNEGVFKTYYPNFLDTVKSQNQLMLYRQAANVHEVEFMKKERQEKEEKAKKSGKKNESNVELDFGESFGGPAEILKGAALNKHVENFLDTLQFKHYTYSFAKTSSYNTSALMVIDFSSHGKVDHQRESGKIYIDLNSYAIIRIECSGDVVVPVLIKPILFFYGIGLENPSYDKVIEFQQIEGLWYPKSIQNNVDIKVSNKHWFKPDEHSDFEIEGVFTVNKTRVEKVAAIPLNKRFDPKKDMKVQAYNDENLSWDNINIIKK